MTGSAFVNPAGGLRYHLRAFRYARRLWQPFRWVVGEWLLNWAPPEKTLVLVGPSAGYNLQPFLFERFERLLVLEPDPVARYLFARRLAAAPLDARPRLELIAEDHLLAEPERLARLLEQSEASVLFCNVLGQLPVLLETTDPKSPALARIHDVVRAALVGRSWASFHDRVSGTLRPSLEGMVSVDGRLSNDELLSAFYAEQGGEHGRPSELTDHLTEGLFPAQLVHAYFSWELEPAVFHLIEGVRAERGAAEDAPEQAPAPGA